MRISKRNGCQTDIKLTDRLLRFLTENAEYIVIMWLTGVTNVVCVIGYVSYRSHTYFWLFSHLGFIANIGCFLCGLTFYSIDSPKLPVHVKCVPNQPARRLIEGMPSLPSRRVLWRIHGRPLACVEAHAQTRKPMSASYYISNMERGRNSENLAQLVR